MPTVGNPITRWDVIDAPRKSNAGPVAKKTSPISFMLTLGVSKPLDVVVNVIVTFLETRITKPMASKTIPANPRPALSTPSAFVNDDV